MTADYPSRKMDQFVVRLPDGMRDRIKAEAEKNGRSMNAEIVATLEEKYPAPSPSDALLGDMQAFREKYANATPEERRELLLTYAARLFGYFGESGGLSEGDWIRFLRDTDYEKSDLPVRLEKPEDD